MAPFDRTSGILTEKRGKKKNAPQIFFSMQRHCRFAKYLVQAPAKFHSANSAITASPESGYKRISTNNPSTIQHHQMHSCAFRGTVDPCWGSEDRSKNSEATNTYSQNTHRIYCHHREVNLIRKLNWTRSIRPGDALPTDKMKIICQFANCHILPVPAFLMRVSICIDQHPHLSIYNTLARSHMSF